MFSDRMQENYKLAYIGGFLQPFLNNVTITVSFCLLLAMFYTLALCLD